MAHNNRHGNNKKEKRMPFTGFDKTQKRDEKGHFIKQNNSDKSKTHNDGNNCYKNVKPCRANDIQVEQRNVAVPDFLSIMNKFLENVISSLDEAKKDYETKPVYSRADMIRAIHKTRNAVFGVVRKHFNKVYRYWFIGGCVLGIAVGSLSVVYGPSIVNFVKNLFA